MAKAFHSFEDAMTRINRSICSYKGKPMYVLCDELNGDRHNVNAYPLGKTTKKDLKVIKITDDAFSYASLPLGYINYDGFAYYLERIPLRQTHAALVPNLIRSKPRNVGGGYFNTQAMEKCILAKHPSYEEAMELVTSGRHNGCAVSRYVAIARNEANQICIYHRGRQIGLYDDMRETFRLVETEEFSYLRRAVTMAGVPL